MAVTYSKPSLMSVTNEEFNTVISSSHLKCSDIMHLGTDSCLRGCFEMGLRSVKGTARFFVPIYLAQLVLKGRNINKEALKELARGFCRAIAFGSFMASGFISTSCILHALNGRYKFYSTAFIPGAFGGLGILLDDPKRRGIVLNTFFTLALEYIATAKGWRLPRFKETSLFMLLSGLLMYQLRTAADRSELYWFFIPPRRTLQVLGECCPHTGPCWKDIVKGGAKFAAIAVVIQLAKIFLSMGLSVVKRRKKVRQRLFSKSTLKQSLSLGGYVFTYKAIHCLLCRRFGEDRPIFAAIAGLLAGSVYAVEPRIDALSSAVTAIITLLLRNRTDKTFLKKVPAGELLMALCNGLFFHARVMDSAHCPPFIVTMMDTASDQRSKEIYSMFLERYHQAVAEGKIPRNGHFEKKEKTCKH